MAKGKVVHSTDGCIVLVEGDKHKRLEPSTHVIQFPGGHIEVSRTSNNEYWAHIWVNKGQVLDDIHMLSKAGEIIESRIERRYPTDDGREILRIQSLDYPEYIEHIAVRIQTHE